MSTITLNNSEVIINIPADECGICLQELINNKTFTKCAHVFHTSCLREWLSIRNTCPQCRTGSPLEELVEIEQDPHLENRDVIAITGPVLMLSDENETGN